MAPQTGVDGIGSLASQEIIGFKVFQHRAVRSQNFAARLGDEAALGIFKVLLILQFEVFGKLGIHRNSRLRGTLG